MSAAGFSATADAFARDPDSGDLWFLSMVGSQTALKAIWASLLKQPPEVAHLIKGADGAELSGGYLRCIHTLPAPLGTWTTKIARLPVTGGWHAMVYTRLAEYRFERDDFLLIARSEDEAPALHHRFLDRRSPLPLHSTWASLAMAQGTPQRRDKTIAFHGNYGLRLLPRCRDDSGKTCPTPLPWVSSPYRRKQVSNG